MKSVAFLGLGVMGGPMAGHLATAGLDVRVYNRTAAKADRWVERYGGQAFATPAAAVEGVDAAIVCVGNDDDLADVILGDEGALAAMRSGGLLIDHTTVSADIARRLFDEALEAGVAFVDAPVSGGEAGAQKGALSIMCGGTEEGYAAAVPVMDHYAARTVHVGGPGAGQQVKMCNQIAIAGVLQGLAEALRFAQASALDTDAVFDAISGGAAQSWQMDNRWKTMAADEFDFGFAIDWMRKDLGLALAEARRNGASLPVAALVDQFYADVQRDGGGRLDTSALVSGMGRAPRSDNDEETP